MANFGRFVCVAVPFCLTLASLVAILVGGLAGVADKSLYMFQVNTTDLQVTPSQVASLLNINTREATKTVKVRTPIATTLFMPTSIVGSGSTSGTSDKSTTATTVSTNLTAEELGVYNLYNVGLWGYCYTAKNGSTGCTQSKYNWAVDAVNMTLSSTNIDSFITLAGYNITLPSGVKDGLNSFAAVTRWTEIVFIIAVVALGVELFFGLFAECSRAFSCITFIIALFATVAVCAAAALATAMSVVVVGTLEATAKLYGVTASFNTRFLATVWIAAAFAIAAGFFWLFTICCCAPDHRRRGPRSYPRHVDEQGEKLIPAGAYVPIHPEGHPQPYNGAYGQPSPQYGYASGANGPRRDLAYEPYSHANV